MEIEMEHTCGGIVFELETGALFCLNCGELDGHTGLDNRGGVIPVGNDGDNVVEDKVSLLNRLATWIWFGGE